ncbi:MAG: NAD(P)H-hydrate epimerase, partial [Pseudomonadota bacterium]|nr:NAD(P)H-hydrate epimerase [Pseudomonadota bacterium]
MSWRTILTADEMRTAEAAAITGGTPVETLMERAGTAATEAIWRHAGPLPALVLCGPGNNGGDGYVIARSLQERGVKVRVAALGEPQSPAAKAARDSWGQSIEDLGGNPPAPLLVDALFGTGLKRGLDEQTAFELMRLAAAARVRVAVDLPSGAATDDGRLLSPLPEYDLTITFQTLKPSHLLQPAARHMGRIAICDIGVEAMSRLHQIGAPAIARPGPDDHKYTRGYVAVIAGDMPGASALTAAAAARAGAGYVRLVAGRRVPAVPSAIVQSVGDTAAVHDARTGAVALGPGLGRSQWARDTLDGVIEGDVPLVLDADALSLLSADGPEALKRAKHLPILTPHAGEFGRLFGALTGSKVEQAREAARLSGTVIVFKGPDT